MTTSTARTLSEEPGPKATCPACGRPIAVLASGLCLYCGKPVPVKMRPAQKAEHDSAIAQAFAELDATPGSFSTGGSGFGKWAIRLGALGIGALLVFAFMGPCMKS